MDLEHTQLGSHCYVKNCNQRDFLPFTCNVCNHKYCLDHRTYTSHNCCGNDFKDITSLECPICKKSIRMTKGIHSLLIYFLFIYSLELAI